MTRVAYLDMPAGVAGDMLLGALLDAGLPVAVLEEVVDRLGFADVELRVARVMRGALAATKVDVCRGGVPIEGLDDVHVHAGHGHGHGDGHGHDDGHGHGHGHGRSLADVRHLLGHAGDLTRGAWARAAEAFQHLADAEARVHGVQPSTVHFHEVGATDALVDIAGTCVGLEHLGVEALYAGAFPWGSGTVETQHGTMPIPAPATALLMEGHATVPSTETYEQVTPTGAALVRTLARGSRLPAGFVPERTGLGAGSFDRSRVPNVVRLVIGRVDETSAHDEAVLLETNLDDVSGQVAAHALERALAAGALDAWFAPVTMKKGRPGVVLSILARPDDAARLETLLFDETPTLGVRRRSVARRILARRHEDVATPWGTVRMKVREAPSGEAATPEYEDCAGLAARAGVPVRAVMDAAQAAWQASRPPAAPSASSPPPSDG